MWNRWSEGQSLSEIGRALGKSAASIHGLLSRSGGIRPRARSRSRRSLSIGEREEISRGLAAGLSIRAIARQLGRAPSTVSREVARNEGRIRYRAKKADERAWARARRPRACRLDADLQLRRTVCEKLKLDWSPEQVAGWMKSSGGDRKRISHESIYRWLYRRPSIGWKQLMSHLRTNRVMRRSRRSSTQGQERGRIVDAIPISQRPLEIESRSTVGHWEGDLIAGAGNTHIATLVERLSRFTLLVKVKGKDTKSVVSAVTRRLKRLPSCLRLSLTWDRGTEMADHKILSAQTNMPIYFCDPRSPWQRGTNENTNRLLRQYYPKGTSLAKYSQSDLNKVAVRLNRRPRKTLGFKSPESELMAAVALTA